MKAYKIAVLNCNIEHQTQRLINATGELRSYLLKDIYRMNQSLRNVQTNYFNLKNQ